MKYVRCLRGSKRRSQPGGSGRSDVFGRAVRGRAVVGRLLLYVRALSEPAAGSRPTAIARPEMPKLPSSRGGGAGGARAVDGGGDAFQIDGELSGSAARDGGARTRSCCAKVDRGGDCRGLQRSSRVSGCVGGTRGVSRRLRRGFATLRIDGVGAKKNRTRRALLAPPRLVRRDGVADGH